MLQRIQSVLLFFAAAGFLSLLKFPFAESNITATPFFEDMAFTGMDHIILMILTILGALISLFAIFKFNNRALQIRLCYIGMILAFFMAIVAVWLVYSQSPEWSEELNLEDGPGLYIAAVVLILIILANRYISKDEKTVRSMDRLR